jgi:hypothetical protein
MATRRINTELFTIDGGTVYVLHIRHGRRPVKQ